MGKARTRWGQEGGGESRSGRARQEWEGGGRERRAQGEGWRREGKVRGRGMCKEGDGREEGGERREVAVRGRRDGARKGGRR